jgi:sporulation protein YlmC with PRC-barrel domain
MASGLQIAAHEEAIMSDMDTVSRIKGVLVVSEKEAANLGTVDNVLIDPESRKLSAVAFKNRHTGEDVFVESADITRIGVDVILINEQASAKSIAEGERPGRQLRTLRGVRVTTHGGKLLGKLEDFHIDHETRILTELHLDHGRTLPVSAKEVIIGPDEILVPMEYADRVFESPERKGFFERVKRWTERTITTDNRAGHRPGH